MIALLWLLLAILASPLRSKCQLEPENVALPHQVVVLRRQMHGPIRLMNLDRLVLSSLTGGFRQSFGPSDGILSGLYHHYSRV
jgi:hypothetical protein